MRAIIVFVLLFAASASAVSQTEPADRACRVIVGSPDVDASGEFVRPAPSDQQCAAVSALQEKFLQTNPRDLRQVRNFSRLPNSVQLYISRLDGQRRGGVDVQVRRTPQQLPGVVVWSGTELVVMAYRVSDFSGTPTTVVVADLDSFTACAYLRWRGGALPATLSIEDIQAALAGGRLGQREVPECNLRSLPID